ncbi:MAG: flippase-like domain-containing protein [Deltaproteobacteria bacterium]|nr:flippase-like domain-containing protein [Deltaproteobacteria bacterium]
MSTAQAEDPRPAAASPAQRWIGRAMLVAGIVLFIVMLHDSDLPGAGKILAATGPILLLGAFPYLVQIALDSLAWRTLLEALGRRVRWRRLIAIRLSTEAVLMSVPAGTFVGETLKPYLLAKTDGVPASDTLATIGVKKALLTFAEAVYLSTALVVGWSLLSNDSVRIMGRGGLPYLVCGAVVLLLVVAAFLSMAFLGGRTGDLLHRALRRLPSHRFRAWIESKRAGFEATDSAFVRLRNAPRRVRVVSFVMLLGAWFTETAETWVLLSLLDIHLPITDVLVMEAIVVFMRNLAFFVPAGLGVQDAGYIAFLHAFAIPNAAAAAAAFVIVKRLKELLWVAIGYGSLFFLTTRVRPPGTTVLVTTTEPA